MDKELIKAIQIAPRAILTHASLEADNWEAIYNKVLTSEKNLQSNINNQL